MKSRVVVWLLIGTVGGAVVATALTRISGWAWLPEPLPSEHAATPPPASAETFFTCGMHPEVVRHEAGTCPICGMKLVPGKSSSDIADDDDSVVRVAPSFRQNFAVRTTPAVRGSLPVLIRTVGILAHNEEKLVAVSTKFEGWIETAYVNTVGESVAKGDTLFEIYSPQLVTTQRDYLAAQAYVARLTASGAYPQAVERAQSLLDAARTRLRYWDVAEAQIDALGRSGTVARAVPFVSPATGFVVDKMGDSLEGMKIEPGMAVLKIADHSTLWAQAKFYEDDLRHVREGSEATVATDAFPERRWRGRILFFRSAVDPQTRALTAFVEIDNADLALRPKMYVDITIRAAAVADAVLVPAEAVLHSGERAVVVVANEDGSFQPREVAVGLVAEGMQEITAGIAPGDQVVVASQFLIDSESNLRAAAAQLLRGEGGESRPEKPETAPAHHHHHH